MDKNRLRRPECAHRDALAAVLIHFHAGVPDLTSAAGLEHQHLTSRVMQQDDGMSIPQGMTDEFEHMIKPGLQFLFVGCLRTDYRDLIEDVHLLVAYRQFTRLLVLQNEEREGTHHWFDGSDYVRGDALLDRLDVDDGDDTSMQEDGKASPGSGRKDRLAPVGIRAEVLDDDWFLRMHDVCKIPGQAFPVEAAFSTANDGGGDVRPSLDAQLPQRTDGHQCHTARWHEMRNHLYGPLCRLPARTFLEDALQFVQLNDTGSTCHAHINCILATIDRFSILLSPRVSARSWRQKIPSRREECDARRRVWSHTPQTCTSARGAPCGCTLPPGPRRR